MITSVPDPEELTDDERYEMDFHGGNFHEQGKTVHGEVPLGRVGSKWRLVDGERGKGQGFHSIDLLCTAEDGSQFFICQTGSRMTIIDEDGEKVYTSFTGVEHVDGRVVKLDVRRRDEPVYAELYPREHPEFTELSEL